MVSLSNNTQGNVNISTRNGTGVNLTSNNDTDVNANMNGNAQRAKSWAVGEGLIDGVDYSAKYYAGQAKESEEIAERSIQSEGNAQIWAEGTDEEVQTLGGEHSSKGWVDYVMENAPTATVEQTAGGATITITDINGTTTADILNGAKGDKGDTGAQGEQGIQGAKGDKGDKGDTGASGAAATITVGTVTTGAAGTNASITNSGTSSAAVFDFTIPKGDKGEQGIQGIQGEQGIQGIQGEKGDKGDTGATGQTGATGNGISDVSKISTVGLVDTYRMLYTNGSYFDYTVTNGENGTGSVADVQVNGVSVLTDNVANIDLTNYVTTDTVQNITAEKTFVGNKLLKFKGANSSSKLGFTAFDSSNREIGYLEAQGQGNASHKCRLGVYDTNTSNYDNILGFEYYKAKGSDGVLHRYNLLCPPLYPSTTDASYYIPMAITDGNTTVMADNTGSVDISSLLPDVSGYVTNTSLATTLADYVTNSALTTTLSDYALLSDIPDISTKQDTLVSGTNIKTINDTSLLGSGNIDTANVYWATYGTTTYADMLSAINDGKLVLCTYNADTYYYIGSGGGYISFVTNTVGTNYVITVDSSDNWTNDSRDFPTKTSDLTNDSGYLDGNDFKTINNTNIVGSGNIDTSEIFIATYGTTTYADVLTAYNAGKTIICKYGAATPFYLQLETWYLTVFKFFTIDTINKSIFYTELDNSDNWSTNSTHLANTDLSNLSTTGQAVIDAKVDDDDYYYKSGDTTSIGGSYGGYVTTSGTEVNFTITLPKSLANITSINCTALTTSFRKSTGGYAPSQNWNAKANAQSISIWRVSNFQLSISVKYGSYGFTNNTPVGLGASISLSFT